MLFRSGWDTVPIEGRFSPDGKLIAYSGPKDHRSRVFLLALDTLSQTEIVPSHSSVAAPRWSNDGRHLLFKSDQSGTVDLWAQRIEKGRPVGEPSVVKHDIGLRTQLGRVLKDGRLIYTAGTAPSQVYRADVAQDTGQDRKSTRLNSSHSRASRMPSSA